MASQVTKIDPHWNYFLAIERDLETLARYVEFDPKNFTSFSIEIARLLLAAAAEVDIVCNRSAVKPILRQRRTESMRIAIVSWCSFRSSVTTGS
jgi:hypothetical protein